MFNLSPPNVDLSIIIVNYNLAEEIENCLRSIHETIDSLGTINFEIIIIDNNSAETELYDVENKFKLDNIHFYYLKENLGFGKGCNFGFAKSAGQYICFLNPDTIISEEIFTPIINLLHKNKSVGIVGPKQLVRNYIFDLSAGFYPNIFFELFHLLGVGVFFEGFITYLISKVKKENYFNVDWILGGAIFIRAEIFDLVNGFDKDYFMFSEEVDLCKRVSNLGLKVVYYPRLQINHIGSVSGKKNYTLYTIRTYSSRELFITKHYKSINKILMRYFLRVELITQMFIWCLLSPINKNKSKQKLKAFFYLLTHNMKYEHRN